MRIALYQGKCWISRAIRWQTRSLYSHAAFLARDGTVIEAWQPCVRLVQSLSAQHSPGTVVDIFDFVQPLSQEEDEQLWKLAMADRGIPYDYVGVLRFISRRPEDERSNDRLFCSEQVFSRCKEIGRSLLERTEAWRVPPDWISRSPLLRLVETVITT